MITLNLKGIACLLLCLIYFSSYSQNSNVSIGTESLKERALLWLKAEGNQGLLLPAVSNRNTFTGLNNSDEKGMMIYDNSDNKIYYWNGNAWVEASGGTGSNQTLTLNGNTFTLTGSPASNVNLVSGTPQSGQALMWNGTAWTAVTIAGDVTGPATAAVVSGIHGRSVPALPASPNALVYNGSAWVFQPLSSTGEANTASNVGSNGVGVFKQKIGNNLEFRNINAGSNRITVTQDAGNNEVDIDVNQINLSIASTQVTGLGTLATLSAITSAQITDGTITNNDISLTANIQVTKLAAGTNGQVLTVTGGVPTWSTPAGSGTVTNIATGTGLTGGPITGTGTISIAPSGVSAAELADNAVTTAKISANAVDNTKLADNAVTTLKVANNAINSAKIVDASITGADIAPATITADKLAQSAATPGQVLKWNGTNWVAQNDDTGAGSVPTLATGQILVGDGSTNSAAALSGDATLSGGAITISTNAITTAKINANAVDNTKLADNAVTTAKVANNAINSAKIVDASITGADIAPVTITADKLAQSAAAANQVLQWNGTNWIPVTLPSGWLLTGNAGTTAGTNFIGTTDDQSFEIKVNNTRIARYELNTSPFTSGLLSPNIINGYFENSAAAGVKGSVISGGGLNNPNTVDGDWASVGGGRDNHAGRLSPYSAYATVGGGASNSALSQWSTIAGGKNNTANGSGTAIPGGFRLIATSFGSTVVGTANEDPSGLGYTTNSWVATDPVFIVGNGQVLSDGSMQTRSNALMILKNGRIGAGRNPSANVFEVEGDASKTAAGSWLANSDRRIKTDIQDIDNSFALIKKLRPVKFRYTAEWKEKHPSLKDQYYYNFIAQEYQEVFPESVKLSGEKLDGNPDGILQIDTYNAQIATIKAVQELITKVEALEAENQKLKSENGTLESKLSTFEKELVEIKSMLGYPTSKKD